MDNIEIVNINDEDFVLVSQPDGGYTSMPKALWDELEAQREQSGTL